MKYIVDVVPALNEHLSILNPSLGLELVQHVGHMKQDQDRDVADTAVNLDESIKFNLHPKIKEIQTAEENDKKKQEHDAQLLERDKWEIAEEERKRKEDEEDKMDVESFFMQRFKAVKGKGMSKKQIGFFKNIENGKRGLQHRNSFTSISSSISK